MAARIDRPDDAAVMEEMGLSQTEQRDEGGAADGLAGMTPAQLVEEAGAEFHSENLDRLRTWSIVAGFGLAIISGFGGFALSGIILRPVRDITEVASEIGATNLSRRINHVGPDDELKQLADTFDSMIARIERGFEAQRRFVQDASHELRTPLASIRTNIEVAELAREGEGADANEEQRALLETVKGQTERLTRLSEDLLLLTLEYAVLETESGEVRLSVAAWGPDGERTFCEGHAGQVALAPGESVPYSARLAPQAHELRDPTVGAIEDGVLPPWRFAGMAFGQCRQTDLELLGPVRFEAANLGEPAAEDYYPFGPPSCNFAGDTGPNGRPYWTPPEGLPETDCG